MEANQVFAILRKNIKSALSGIARIEETPTGFKIITKDGNSFSYTIPNFHKHDNKTDILDKFSLDSDTGELLFDGNSIGNNSGIKIVDNYSKLSTTVTDYELNYCLNDYTDISVTPNVTYPKGFYLFNKISSKWISLMTNGDIASNTSLGNVIIKKDGGVEVDDQGNIWVSGYTKTETTDPVTGDKTTTTTIGGITTTVIENPNGNKKEETVIGGMPISTETKTDSITGEKTTTSIVGNTTTTTTESTNSSTGETSISTIKVDSSTGEISEVVEKKDSSGNTTESTVTNKDKDGNVTNKITTTIETKTDSITGYSIKETVVTNKNSSGITKVDTTTENQTTGTVNNKTEYEADSKLLANRDDVDSVYDDIFSDLGW